MKDYIDNLVELVRLTSTDLPPDVEFALRDARSREVEGSAARGAMETILRNVEIAREQSTPICQDTGTPLFWVNLPEGTGMRSFTDQIHRAVQRATVLNYLRPNAVDPISGKNTGDNRGDEHYPVIHYSEVDSGAPITVELMLKGGGCENVGAQYKLPHSATGAGRDLEGVRRVVLHAVNEAQGRGCAPGFLGVAIGGDRGTSYLASKEVLLKRVEERSENSALAELESRVTEEANLLEIGPMGFGGETTVVDIKITSTYRLPASYFVTVSYMCWAYRRRKMTISGDAVAFE